jgi:chromosome segregation ATPase
MTDLPLPEPAWIVALRKELFMSKMTHSFTFSRDETMELLDMHLQSAAKTAELQAECGKLQADIFHLRDDFSEMAALKNKVEAECARLRERLDTASSANSELYGACTRQVKNIEAWLETGEPAGPDESKSIYEQLCKAIDRCPMDIAAALRGKESGDGK